MDVKFAGCGRVWVHAGGEPDDGEDNGGGLPRVPADGVVPDGQSQRRTSKRNDIVIADLSSRIARQ